MSDFWKDYEPEPTRAAPMTTERALDLALEALQFKNILNACGQYFVVDPAKAAEAITAIKQALAAPVQEPVKGNSNYRLDPPGLDPAGGTQVSKVWWDGEKLMAKPIPLVDFYQPVQDSTCSETLRAQGKAYPRTCRKCGKGPCIGAPKQLLAAQRPVAEPHKWVGLTDEEIGDALSVWELTEEWPTFAYAARAIEAKLKEKNESHRQHVTDGNPCWCGPETSYTDPETGASVIVHKEPQ